MKKALIVGLVTLGNKCGGILLDGACTLPSLTSGQWIRNRRDPFWFV